MCSYIYLYVIMASVFYYNYHCLCGQLLFTNSEIESSTSCCKRNYIFVERHDNLQIYISGSNCIKCESCHSSIGGMVYRGYIQQKDLARFVGHKIERVRVELTIHQLADENDVIIPGELRSSLVFRKPESRHYIQK